MVCNLIDLMNVKLEEIYDAMVWVVMTVRQTSVFDANKIGVQARADLVQTMQTMKTFQTGQAHRERKLRSFNPERWGME